MKIGIIGTGNIGSTEGRLWDKAGHQILYGSRHPASLLDRDMGENVQIGSIKEAATFGEVILLAIPWDGIDEVLSEINPFISEKIVIDATNQYGFNEDTGKNGLIQLPNHQTATSYNTQRIKSKGLVKAYNTLTAGFQWKVGSDPKNEGVVMPYSGNTEEAKTMVAGLIRDSGFVPYDVGHSEMARFIEPPRGSTSLYGEEWSIDTIEKRLKELKDTISI